MKGSGLQMNTFTLYNRNVLTTNAKNLLIKFSHQFVIQIISSSSALKWSSLLTLPSQYSQTLVLGGQWLVWACTPKPNSAIGRRAQ